MQSETDTPIPIVIYQSADGSIATEVKLQDETVWLTQRQMGELFAATPENVLMHLKNIYQDGELAESATTKDFLVVQQEGSRQVGRELDQLVYAFYDLAPEEIQIVESAAK